jgi:shikimate dehydrogenase
VVSQSLQEICCCMGQPVAGNPAQYVMEKAFTGAGLDWRYLTLEVPPGALEDAIRGLRAFGFQGANVMLPHKAMVTAYVDELSEVAELAGAVTCITRQEERLVGENADGKGLLKSLQEVTEPTGKQVVLLGAGSAARAVAVELSLAGAAGITVVNRSEAAATDLVERLRGRFDVAAESVVIDGDYAVAAETDILINATPIGIGDADARVPIDMATLPSALVVADLAYNPPETRLLRDAADRGCTTVDGLGMLVNQVLLVFHLWTGLDADTGAVREAIEEFLGL